MIKGTKTRYTGVTRISEGSSKGQYFWRAYGPRPVGGGKRPTQSDIAPTAERARDARAAAITTMQFRSDEMESSALPEDITVEEYIRDFLKRREGIQKIDRGTHHSFLSCMKRMAQREGVRGILHMKMTAVRSSHIDNLYTDLRIGGGQVSSPGKPYACKSIVQCHDLLSVAFGKAVPEFITYNPMERIEKPYQDEIKVQEAEPKHFTLEEARRLQAQAESMVESEWSRNRAAKGKGFQEGYARIAIFWLISFDLGLRIGEAAGLKEEWFDLEAGVVRACSQRTYEAGADGVPRRLVEKCLKGRANGDKGKLLVLSPQTLAAVRAHINKTKCEQLEYGPGYVKSGYLIVHWDGRPYTPGELYSRHRRLCRLTGVEYKSPHSMRHSTATWMVNSPDLGIDDAKVRLGHVNIKTTELYATVSEQTEIRNQRAAADAIGNMLFGT